MAKPSSSILVVGGRVELHDTGPRAWENFMRLFDVLAKMSKTKVATLEFDLPDIKRSFLDAVPQDYLEKKYKVRILDGRVEVLLPIAKNILGQAKGFDIGVKIGAVEMIFFHTSKLEILTELQLAAAISGLVQKMFPKAKIK